MNNEEKENILSSNWIAMVILFTMMFMSNPTPVKHNVVNIFLDGDKADV